MRIEKYLGRIVPLLILVLTVGLPHANAGTTGELWFGGQGPSTNTASGVSDNRIGYINTTGASFVTIETDPSTNSFYSVALDTNDNLYFALGSDGTLRSGQINVGPSVQTFSGEELSSLYYIGDPGDAQYVSGTTGVAQLSTKDAGLAVNADAPTVFVQGPFGTLGSFSASYTLVSSNVPAGTSPYWVLWVNAPGDTNANDEFAIIQYSVGASLNDSSKIHVFDPHNVLPSYIGDTLATLNSTSVGSFTFADMIVDWAGVEIGDWVVNDNIGASADIESLAISSVTANTLHSAQITDVPLNDLAYAFTIDTVKHLLYMGLWGADSSGADLIEIPYNPTTGVVSSPYDPTIGEITNQAGVLLSFQSTGLNFVMARQMWLAPGGTNLYYADNDFGDPGDFADQVKINGVYVVDTTANNPQPTLLTLPSQFPADNSQGYIIGMTVNPAKNLIYFATSGSVPGVGTASNTIWSMPITGGAATHMPMPAGVSLVYPNNAGGCLALDPSKQILYVSDEGSGTVIQLFLSATGTNFTSGSDTFFVLDSKHLKDNGNNFPSAFVQGMDFISVATGSPPPPTTQLTIAREGTNVVVSWGLQYSSYALQSASVLVSNAWSDYPGPFFTNTSTIMVTNAISATNRFFRLFY
jgi:hypothetical protein